MKYNSITKNKNNCLTLYSIMLFKRNVMMKNLRTQNALPLSVKPPQLPGGKVSTLVHVIESLSLSELLKCLE